MYEKYVVELRDETSAQHKLFKELPSEFDKRSLGAVYTPHFIARFFSRALQRQVTPAKFTSLAVLDPAVGSGIFLRTLIERQCAPSELEGAEGIARKAMEQSTGVDIDPDACNAARLSLSLLYFSITGKLPKALNIVNQEAIQFAQEALKAPSSRFDAIMANPPFVKYERLQENIQERVRDYLGETGKGRVDLYLGLLKVALDLCANDGFVLYVLPEAFLTSSSATDLRNRISKEFEVLYFVDISAVSVFEGVGAYVILLVLQRKPAIKGAVRKCMVAKCRKNIPSALTMLLRNEHAQTDSYTVFSVGQEVFEEAEWKLAEPKELRVLKMFEQHPRLVDLLNLNQGIVTGQDDLFVVPADHPVAVANPEVWRPLLRDREMIQFRMPASTRNVVFYPFDENGKKLPEQFIQQNCKETWKYLTLHKAQLSKRKSVVSDRFSWWQPESPRNPIVMLSPKIICPHLMLSPRFGLDEGGGYLVSRSPVLTSKAVEDSSFELMRYLVAVLNSPYSFWQLQYHSSKVSRGYLRVELATLKHIRVPDPAKISRRDMQVILDGVKELMLRKTGNARVLTLIKNMNENIRKLYGLDESTAAELG